MRDGKGAGSGNRLLRRVLAPFARRGAEPLLEDPAEVGKVVEAPCECDVADVPSHLRGVRQIALASLQTLHLDIAAERDLFGGHQIAGIARRNSNSRRGARHRQFGVAQMCQDIIFEPIEQRGPVKRLIRRTPDAACRRRPLRRDPAPGRAGGLRWRDRRGRSSCSCRAGTHRPVVRAEGRWRKWSRSTCRTSRCAVAAASGAVWKIVCEKPSLKCNS